MAIILLNSATTKGHYKGDALPSTWKKITRKSEYNTNAN